MRLYIPRFIAFITLLLAIPMSVWILRSFGVGMFALSSIGEMLSIVALMYYISRY